MTRKKTWSLVAVVIAAAWFCMERLAYKFDTGHYWPQAEDPRTLEGNRRKAAILTEIEALGEGHDWAGSYGTSSGFSGDSLLLAPKSGFLCNTTYDFPTGETRGWGDVRQEGTVLHLLGGSFDDPEKCLASASKMWIARWGDRRYLLAPGQIMHFVNDVNYRQEPRFTDRGSTLLRAGDELKPAPGKPVLPPRYARGLLAKPIDAVILSVGALSKPVDNGKQSLPEPRFYPVILSVGHKSGVMENMEFHVEDKTAWWQASVGTVRRETSLAWVRSWENQPPPRVGDNVSTCPTHRRRVEPVDEPIRLITRKISPRSYPPLKSGVRILFEFEPPNVPSDFRRVLLASIDWSGAAEELYDWRKQIPELVDIAAAMGGNVLVVPSKPRESKGLYPFRASGLVYRLEFEGVPVEAVALDYACPRVLGACDWSMARKKTRLERHPYARAAAEARRNALGRALKMSNEEMERWGSLRIEDLTLAQREAHVRYYCLKGDRGLVHMHVSKERDNAALERDLLPAAKSVQRAMPAAYKEYEALEHNFERDLEFANKKAAAKP